MMCVDVRNAQRMTAVDLMRARASTPTVLIDTMCMNENLPHSIEAIFYPASCVAGSQCRRDAEDTHTNFVREYGLRAGGSGGEEGFSLLVLDVENWEEPFSLAM